jgi:hypothetical protein
MLEYNIVEILSYRYWLEARFVLRGWHVLYVGEVLDSSIGHEQGAH